MTTSEAQRLAALRATDRIGLYAADGPTTASDSTGTVRLTLDPTNCVSGIEITHLDDRHRTPSAVATLVEEAYRAAILAKSPVRPELERADAVERPRAVMFPRPPERRLDNIMRSGRALAPMPPDEASFSVARAVGQSGNGCVSVALPAGQSKGELDIDPGWLANAAAANVAAAITQAYAAAYQERDRA